MVKNQKITKKNIFFLVLFLFFTSFLSLKTFQKIVLKDIKIYGTELFSTKDVVENSSLKLQTRLVFIKTKFIEKELQENLSLEKVFLNRQILPFGLKVYIKTRTPIAYGEKLLNGRKIKGFIDKDGFFINKNHADKKNMENLTIKVFGWQAKYRKTLSKILISEKNNELELIKVSFSQNGFLTLEERDLKTILLGFNENLVESQLQIINKLKYHLNNNDFSKTIDNVDLTDPNNPKIKVFKP